MNASSTTPQPNPGTANPERALRAYYTREYPKELWYFLAALLFTVALFQSVAFLAVKILRRNRTRQESNFDSEADGVAVNNQISLRRIPSAIVNAFRVVAFRSTINIGQSYSLNLAEVTLTCAYIIALFTWTFINTTDFTGHKLTASYFSNRSGSLAASQFPLITALGTKNNVVSLITGVSYDKLNYLHRMTARVVFVLMWVHIGCKISKGFDVHEGLVQAGILVAVAFVILCIVSLRPIRAIGYELFFYIHFLTVLMILVGVYYHVREFKFDNYIWPSFIIWGLDRLIRGIRLVVFNHSYFNFFKSGSGVLDAKVELLSEHFVRLTLKRPPHFHWSPGQTGYLITPGVSTLPFEAHPFTIASYDSSSDPKPPTLGEKPGDSLTEGPQGNLDEGALAYWKELVFLINVREGYTRRLGDIAARKGSIKAFVDGPYGPSPDLSQFDTSVFIAGGSGVSYTLPVFIHAVELVRKGKSTCRRLVFLWAIRDRSHLQWISDALHNVLLRIPDGLDVEIRIFLTGQESPNAIQWDNDSVHSRSASGEASDSGIEESSVREKERSVPSLLRLAPVSVTHGRPDVKEILNSEADKTRGGRMSVCVCGSSSVARGVRSALRFPISGPTEVLRGGASVTLHIESFGYA